MELFTVRELRERSGELSLAAEQGKLSVVTRHGSPLFVTVPFTDQLLENGVPTSLGLSLFKSGELSAGRAAKLCGIGKPEFLEYASSLGIPVVDYDPSELEFELAVLR